LVIVLGFGGGGGGGGFAVLRVLHFFVFTQALFV
jgi:hypothetical protein